MTRADPPGSRQLMSGVDEPWSWWPAVGVTAVIAVPILKLCAT
jgi:hypothetical protein